MTVSLRRNTHASAARHRQRAPTRHPTVGTLLLAWLLASGQIFTPICQCIDAGDTAAASGACHHVARGMTIVAHPAAAAARRDALPSDHEHVPQCPHCDHRFGVATRDSAQSGFDVLPIAVGLVATLPQTTGAVQDVALPTRKHPPPTCGPPVLHLTRALRL